MIRSCLTLAVAVLLSCEAVDSPPGVLVRDSAGIEIVENRPAKLAGLPNWILSERPSLILSSTDQVTLWQITGITPLPDSRLAVANSGTFEVLVFRPDGALVRRIGGPGEGPGEFGSVGSVISLPGDSLAVFDPRRRRLTVFGPEGEPAREFSVGDLVPAMGFTQLLPLSSKGYVLFLTRRFPDESEPGIFRPPAESLRLSHDGRVLDSLGIFPGAEVFLSEAGAGVLMFGKVPLPATIGDRFVIATGEAPEIRHYNFGGELLRISRWPDFDRAVTPERLNETLEIGLQNLPESQRAAARQMARRFPHAEEFPPYGKILISDEGELWVSCYMGPEMAVPGQTPERCSWLVFDSSGVAIARSETPARFHAFAVRDGTMIGVHADEAGAEEIWGLPIRR